MPRPQRCRRICGEPRCQAFSPDGQSSADVVSLTIDEYEVIRLVDHEKRTHEQAAAQMDVSRTTVTEIYESARSKIAAALVEGRRLLIAGGHYRLCDGSAAVLCGKRCAHALGRTCTCGKDGNSMRIAVTYENGQVFGHFGHTEQFKLYNVAEGHVTDECVVDTNGSGHGALAGFLKEHQVDTLICGGIGGGAQAALAEAGIRLYGGVSSSADEAVRALLAGKLVYQPDVRCEHHEHAEGHICGAHGCGEHHDCH